MSFVIKKSYYYSYLSQKVGEVPIHPKHQLPRAQGTPFAKLGHLISSIAALNLALQKQKNQESSLAEEQSICFDACSVFDHRLENFCILVTKCEFVSLLIGSNVKTLRHTTKHFCPPPYNNAAIRA